MKKQTDADVIRIVSRYRQAGIGEVEVVLKDYLALADEYGGGGGRAMGRRVGSTSSGASVKHDLRCFTKPREKRMHTGSMRVARLRSESA